MAVSQPLGIKDRPGTCAALADLGARSLQQFIELEDFVAFTGNSYVRFDNAVKAGHIRGTVVNAMSNTKLDVVDLAPQLLGYLDNELPRIFLHQLVSTFEYFFFDLLAILLEYNPHAMPQGRQMSVGDVLSSASRDDLVRSLIQKELHDLGYKSVPEWFAFLAKVITNPVGEADIQRLAEIKATRDLLAHNNGIINETYLRKAGNNARGNAGDPVPIGRPYVYDAARFLKGLSESSVVGVRSKLGCS